MEYVSNVMSLITRQIHASTNFQAFDPRTMYLQIARHVENNRMVFGTRHNVTIVSTL